MKEKDFFQNNMPCDSLIFDVLQANSDTFNSTLYDNMVIIKKYFNKKQIIHKLFLKYLI